MSAGFRWGVVALCAVAACAELREGDAISDAGANETHDAAEGDASDTHDASDDAPIDRKGGADVAADVDESRDGSGDAAMRAPEVLVSGLVHPLELVRDGDTLYFTVANDPAAEVRKVLVDGGGSQIVAPFDAASGAGTLANDLSLRGQEIVWTNGSTGGGVFAISKNGGARRKIGPSFDQAYHSYGYGTDTYLVDRSIGPFTYAVQRIADDGGGHEKVADFQIRVGGLAVDSSGVYWTVGGALANGKNGLRRRATGADAAVDLHIGNDNGAMGGLALSADRVFWVEAEGGRVLSVDKAGGLVTVHASSLDSPLRVIVDGAWLYFTEHGSSASATGTVRRAPVGGGAVETLANNQDHPVGIAVDAKYVYWTSYGGGEVLRVAK